jgi:hypothetical protein
MSVAPVVTNGIQLNLRDIHGHGAILARDVRDRQQLPEQISAAGVNAVLVAPQFAVDAADASAGKFWEPDGFKRFLGRRKSSPRSTAIRTALQPSPICRS